MSVKVHSLSSVLGFVERTFFLLVSRCPNIVISGVANLLRFFSVKSGNDLKYPAVTARRIVEIGWKPKDPCRNHSLSIEVNC